MAYRDGKNPFMDDPEDDFSFAASKRDADDFGPRPPRKDGLGSSEPPSYGDPPSRYEVLQQQKQASMNRQLEGTQRCLASIYDAESTGIATAEVRPLMCLKCH